MRFRAALQALCASLLLLTAAGISGCGNSNSLSSLVVLPAAPVVAKGAITKLTVVAVFSSGLTVGAWTRVTWASSDPTVATVSSTGIVTGGTTSVGTAVITATDMSHPSISASVTISVTELQSITVLPAVASITTGTQQFTAIGTYTASTPSSWSTSTTWPDVDLTTQVLWTSSSTTVATIGSSGLATAGTSTGTTTITATEIVTRITGTSVSGTATLNVN